jgi:DNA-binding response OmpR family regulator
MKHIILADDDTAMRDVFKIIFQRSGYSVTIYANAEALMKNEFALPDIFILDKQLSGVDGFDVCRYLKKQESTKNVPVLITSASPYIAEAAAEAGADAFIEKPFKMKELLNLVETILNNDYFTAAV